MNKYLVQLAELDWVKVLGIGVVLAVAYYFLMYDNGAALEANIKQSSDLLASSKKQLQQTQRAIEDANRFEKEVLETDRQFEKIVEFMPPTIGAAELTSIINKQAQAAGLTPRISPKGEEKAVTFYQVSKVDIELDGTFAQILSFLSNISRVPRLLTFEHIALKMPTAGPSGALTFSGTLQGYRYLRDAPESKTADAAKPGGTP